MKHLSALVLLQFMLMASAFSQLTTGVNLDDDYATVINKVKGDPFIEYYTIMQSKEMIRVSVKMGSGLPETSIGEYLFSQNKLRRMYMIQSNNPRETLSFLYRTLSAKYGDPLKIRAEGKEMIYWKKSDIDKMYYYLSHSDWFQKECLFILQTKEQLEKGASPKTTEKPKQKASVHYLLQINSDDPGPSKNIPEEVRKVFKEDDESRLQSVSVDLNGDGIKELLVMGQGGSGSDPYVIFDVTSKRVIGEIGALVIFVQNQKQNGYFVLEGYTSLGWQFGSVTRYAFNGQRYYDVSNLELEGDQKSKYLNDRKDVPHPIGSKSENRAADAKKEEEVKNTWANTLKEMQAAYTDVTAYEKRDVSPELKKAAWSRFLTTYSEDDPYETEDNTMRAKAQTQLAYWGTVKTPISVPVGIVKSSDLPSLSNSIGVELVLVQPGTFQMGSDYGPDYEQPMHSVTISRPFYIGKYEVTQKQWRDVMETNPSAHQGDNRPVENVSWNDAQDFIRKLNEKENTTKYRLPTEAEWEFAARGGAQSNGYKWAGSNNAADVAVYGESGTKPVGSKRPNELGIYDMSGNVFEWCWDWAEGYASTAQTDPKGPTSGSARVLRGGSFVAGGFYCRVAIRYVNGPNFRDRSGLGFRLVRDVD